MYCEFKDTMTSPKSTNISFSQSFMNLSFSEWAYPTKKRQHQLLSLSPCGLLAHVIDDVLTIYMSSGKDSYQPIVSWRPFEHKITAICWYDASDIPDVTLPIIVFASESKRVCVYDLSINKVIASLTLTNSKATILKWSPISSSRFFIGTQSGDILCCAIQTDAEGQILLKVNWLLSVNFEVNFLTFEPSFGDTLAICSKSGSLSFIKRVHSSNPILVSKSYTLSSTRTEIYSCEFLESSPNYMLFVTDKGTFFYTIEEHETITLFNDVKLKKLYPTISNGRRLIGISDEIIALYELINGKVERLCEIQVMPSVTNMKNEFSHCYEYKNDKIVFVSWNWWLTTIKVVRNKLFVVSRVRLLHEKPVNYSLRLGSILISTDKGSLMATIPTSQAVSRFVRPAKSTDVMPSIGNTKLTKASSHKKITLVSPIKAELQPMSHEEPNTETVKGGNSSFDALPTLSFNLPEQKAVPASSFVCDELSSSLSTRTNRRRISMSIQYLTGNDKKSEADKPKNDDLLDDKLIAQQVALMHRQEIEQQQSTSSLPKSKEAQNDSPSSFGYLSKPPLSPSSARSSRKSVPSNVVDPIDLCDSNSAEGSESSARASNTNLLHVPSTGFSLFNNDSSSDSKQMEFPYAGQHRERSLSLHRDAQIAKKLGQSEKNSGQSSDASDLDLCKNQPSKNAFGISRLFKFHFKISNLPLQRIEWVGPSRIFAFGCDYRDRFTNRFYVLDLKTKMVYPILEKRLSQLNMPVTNISINSTKKIACIILDDTLVHFVSLTSTPPSIIGSLNFTSTAYASFSGDGTRAAIISNNTCYMTDIIDPKESNVKIKESYPFDFKHKVTAFYLKRGVLVIGFEDGKVILHNLTNSKSDEIMSIKTPIKSICDFEGSQTQMVVTDIKNNAYIVSHKGIEKSIQHPVKCIQQSSQNDFLVRYAGRGRLSLYNINGNVIPYFSPAVSRCPVIKSKEEWSNMLNEAMRQEKINPVHLAEQYGMPLIRQVIMNIKNHDFTRQQITLIRDIILSDTDLHDLGIHLCLNIGDVDQTRAIALKTDGKSPSFVLNILKALLLQTNPPDEIVQAAVVHLITEGKTKDAIDILLALGKLKNAVEKLISIDEIKEAQCILKMRIRANPELISYTKEVAERIIDSGRFGAGIILYSLADGLDNIIQRYSQLFEFEQAQFVEELVKYH